MIKPIQLPYRYDSLIGFLSPKAVQLHYEKHHSGYANKLNKLIEMKAKEQKQSGSQDDITSKSLTEIVKSPKPESGLDLAIWNNASQVFNHNFFWQSITDKKVSPQTNFFQKNFGSLDKFKQMIADASSSAMGSYWLWLVLNEDMKPEFKIFNTADNPLSGEEKLYPLMVLDLWEHAYYLDYLNEKVRYAEAFCTKINYHFIEKLISEYQNI